jgi:predicted transcriptional regulator
MGGRGRFSVLSHHWLMEVAIEFYIESEEKYKSEKREEQERWERYKLTGKAISHKAATAWLSELAQGKVAQCPK